MYVRKADVPVPAALSKSSIEDMSIMITVITTHFQSEDQVCIATTF